MHRHELVLQFHSTQRQSIAKLRQLHFGDVKKESAGGVQALTASIAIVDAPLYALPDKGQSTSFVSHDARRRSLSEMH